MNIPKISAAAIGSLVAILLGYAFDEAERKEDIGRLRKEMRDYVDKKFDSLNPDLTDHTINRVDR